MPQEEDPTLKKLALTLIPNQICWAPERSMGGHDWMPALQMHDPPGEDEAAQIEVLALQTAARLTANV